MQKLSSFYAFAFRSYFLLLFDFQATAIWMLPAAVVDDDDRSTVILMVRVRVSVATLSSNKLQV